MLFYRTTHPETLLRSVGRPYIARDGSRMVEAEAVRAGWRTAVKSDDITLVADVPIRHRVAFH